MVVNNEKSKTQRTRRNERHLSDSEGDFNSSTGVDEPSNQLGAKSVGLDGKNWPGGNKVKSFVSSTVGKLIDRLINSWKDRRKEAVDCLDWYNNQVSKCDEEINFLELMKVELTEALAEEE